MRLGRIGPMEVMRVVDPPKKKRGAIAEYHRNNRKTNVQATGTLSHNMQHSIATYERSYKLPSTRRLKRDDALNRRDDMEKEVSY